MQPEASALQPILNAYKEVVSASWPDLHPNIVEQSRRWPGASPSELLAQLEGYLQEASLPACNVRVFWKLGPEFRFGGCNQIFAEDAGLPPATIIGLDDYDQRLPWFAQAPKYRTDDEEVFTTGQPKLDIVERQRSAAGIIWVRAGKAPIKTPDGTILGILGMYEILNSAMGRQLFTEQGRQPPSP